MIEEGSFALVEGFIRVLVQADLLVLHGFEIWHQRYEVAAAGENESLCLFKGLKFEGILALLAVSLEAKVVRATEIEVIGLNYAVLVLSTKFCDSCHANGYVEERFGDLACLLPQHILTVEDLLVIFLLWTEVPLGGVE